MNDRSGKFDFKDQDFALDRRPWTLTEIAADKLRELILLEKLPPGTSIAERETAEALGISRTPMRAALAILEQEGLVDYSVTRRPRVANPSLDEIAELLAVMGALEALAGELACVAAEDADIAQVVDLVRQMEAGSETMAPLDFFRTDMEMHFAIVRASGNRPLLETHRRYNARLWRARFVSSRRRAGRDQTLAEHRTIEAAFCARDAKATAAALRAHLTTAVTNLRFALSEPEPGTDKE